MEWYWKTLLVIVCAIIIALIRSCCKFACSDDKVNTTSLTTPIVSPQIGSRPNEADVFRPTNYPVSVSMPMSNRGTLLPIEPVSANNPYPPVQPSSVILRPTAPLSRQHSSSLDNLPPSYDEAIRQQTTNLAMNNIHRPHSAGNLNL